jgi:hypothetical protein
MCINQNIHPFADARSDMALYCVFRKTQVSLEVTVRAMFLLNHFPAVHAGYKLRKNEKNISEHDLLDDSTVYWDMYKYLDSASVMEWKCE